MRRRCRHAAPACGCGRRRGRARRRAARPRCGAGARRRSAASRRRWTARRGRRRCGAARARTSSRSAAAACCEARRGPRLRRVSTWTWRPVSGSTSQRSPAGTSCCSRGSTISTAITPWRARRACSGVSQSRSPRKSETITTRPRWRPSAAALSSAAPSEVAPAPRRSASRRSSASSASRPIRPWRGRMMRGSPPPKASTPSRLPRRVATWPDGQRDALGDVGLAAVGGAEGHRGAHVEHEPGGQRALAHVHAHVGLLQARGRVPVDVADVVAREVRADHRQLGALAGLRRQVLAGDERLDPLHHREVERAQDRGRDGPGPGLGRRALRGGRDEAQAAHGSLPTRARPKPAPASSSTSAPPAKAEVTCCFSLVLVSRVPMLR